MRVGFEPARSRTSMQQMRDSLQTDQQQINTGMHTQARGTEKCTNTNNNLHPTSATAGPYLSGLHQITPRRSFLRATEKHRLVKPQQNYLLAAAAATTVVASIVFVLMVLVVET